MPSDDTQSWTSNLPSSKEHQGLIPTANKQGYMLREPDCLMTDFASFARNKTVVDVGAAYGVASKLALDSGAQRVIAVDPAADHITYMEKHLKPHYSDKLQLLKAAFPCELGIQNGEVDAFLLSRILHFIPPEKVESLLESIYDYLASDGKIFILTLSIYVSYFSEHLPAYEKKKSAGEKWPGLIDNLHENLPEEDKAHNPRFIHLFTTETLTSLLQSKGFIIEECRYSSQEAYPEEMQNGKEDVVLVARKP